MGQKCRLYCVDSWQNDAMSEGQRDTYEEFLRNTKECSDRIIPLRGESTAIAASFGSSIALLFLDGDHSYEGVKADVDAWWPKLRPGGIMAMHDIGWAEGVQRVVSEFIMPNSRAHGRLPNLFWATKIS
jgi:predicted O-methyltransferase YrrM